MEENKNNSSPRFGTLAIADALGFATLFVSLVLFKRLGMGNDETTVLTSLLFTPWIARPLLARLVGRVRQPHLLVIITELLCSLLLVATAMMIDDSASIGSIECLLWTMALCAVVHGLAVERLSHSDDAEDVRCTRALRLLSLFLAMVICQGLLVAFAGNLEVLTRTVRYPWSVAFYVLAAMFAFLTLLHGLTLRAVNNVTETNHYSLITNHYSLITNHHSLITNHYSLITIVMLLAEGLVMQTGQLFLIDARHNGGLGLSPAEYGLTQGTVAVVAVLVGGAMALQRKWNISVRMCISTIAITTIVTAATYIYLTHTLNTDIVVVGLALFLRSMTLGFALTINYRWLKKALGSGLNASAFLAVPLVLGGMVSGPLQESVGYRFYFVAVACFAAATLIVATIITWGKRNVR